MRRCDVDGCDRAHVARGYCQGHYRRWKMHGTPGTEPLRGFRETCTVDGCDRRHIARGYCTAHYQRWRANGDPGAADIKSGVTSYSGAHAQVERLHGPASAHDCRHCGGAAAQWAYDHSDPDPLHHPVYGSPYSTDTDRYLPLCVPCHQTFDAHPLRHRVLAPVGVRQARERA